MLFEVGTQNEHKNTRYANIANPGNRGLTRMSDCFHLAQFCNRNFTYLSPLFTLSHLKLTLGGQNRLHSVVLRTYVALSPQGGSNQSENIVLCHFMFSVQLHTIKSKLNGDYKSEIQDFAFVSQANYILLKY